MGNDLKNSLEFVRTRVVLKALDAVITAPLRPKRGSFSDCQRLLSPRTANYERTASLVGLAERIVPGISTRVSQALIRPTRLPLDASQVKLLGFGSGATVWLLETPVGARVLKIYRRSLGRSAQGLVELAMEFRRKYEIMSRWFNGQFELVLPTDFLVLHGPLLARPAVAAWQPYIVGTLKDLFRDFDSVELLELLRSNPQLGQEVAFFARQAIQLERQLGLAPDIIGKGNVSIGIEAGHQKLRIMDFGLFDMRLIRKASPGIASQLAGCLSRLRLLLRALPPN